MLIRCVTAESHTVGSQKINAMLNPNLSLDRHLMTQQAAGPGSCLAYAYFRIEKSDD